MTRRSPWLFLPAGASSRHGSSQSAALNSQRQTDSRIPAGPAAFMARGRTMLVTAAGREHPPGWKRFDREVVDEVSGQGPLRGVLTALQNADTARVMVLTVDMPLLAPEHLQWLICKSDPMLGHRGIMLSRFIDGKTQIEPFPLLCRIEAAEIISRRLAEGRRSVHSLAEMSGFVVEPAPAEWPAEIWTNLNTPEDWAKL